VPVSDHAITMVQCDPGRARGQGPLSLPVVSGSRGPLAEWIQGLGDPCFRLRTLRHWLLPLVAGRGACERRP
jgi:hypothetical protein